MKSVTAANGKKGLGEKEKQARAQREANVTRTDAKKPISQRANGKVASKGRVAPEPATALQTATVEPLAKSPIRDATTTQMGVTSKVTPQNGCTPEVESAEVTSTPHVESAPEHEATQDTTKNPHVPGSTALETQGSMDAQAETDPKQKKQKEREAHRAAVAVNKERAAQDRENRRKARQDAKEAKQAAKLALGERYNQAARRVSELRALFISALDDKSRILNVPRIGEAVPVRNDALNAVDIEIQQTRGKLKELIRRKRELKGISPELEAVNNRINDLRRQRDEARKEKKAAYAEAVNSLRLTGADTEVDEQRPE